MFALLLITVIIGISANAMDIAGNQIQSSSFEQSSQRIMENAADILIKTPGNPANWEEYRNVNDFIPGLLEDTMGTNVLTPNLLSKRKIFCLKQNPGLVKKLIPSYMNASLVIYPMNPLLTPITITNKNPPDDAADIYVINRTVMYDYGLITPYLCIDPNITCHSYVCTHSYSKFDTHRSPDFNGNVAGWICSPVTIKHDIINSTDFYILTDPQVLADDSAMWIVDRSDNMTENGQKFGSVPVNINTLITRLLRDDDTDVIILHVFLPDTSKLFKVYLVGVPKGTPIQDVKIDNMGYRLAFFVLKIWM